MSKNVYRVLSILLFFILIFFYLIVYPGLTSNIEKPVLYLYPTETTNVKVLFEKSELLTTSYPKYDKKWEEFGLF